MGSSNARPQSTQCRYLMTCFDTTRAQTFRHMHSWIYLFMYGTPTPTQKLPCFILFPHSYCIGAPLATKDSKTSMVDSKFGLLGIERNILHMLRKSWRKQKQQHFPVVWSMCLWECWAASCASMLRNTWPLLDETKNIAITKELFVVCSWLVFCFFGPALLWECWAACTTR